MQFEVYFHVNCATLLIIFPCFFSKISKFYFQTKLCRFVGSSSHGQSTASAGLWRRHLHFRYFNGSRWTTWKGNYWYIRLVKLKDYPFADKFSKMYLALCPQRHSHCYAGKDLISIQVFFQIKFIMIVLKKTYSLFYWIFVQHFNISDTIWSDWRRKIWHWKSRSSVSKWTRSLRSICLRSWPSPWGWPRQSRMMGAEFELRKQFSEERCNVRWYSERGRRRILRFWPSQLLPPFSSSNGAITIFI